jgi:CheY-like chemotaxis protein
MLPDASPLVALTQGDVLVVEDDPGVRLMFELVLEDDGYRVRTATTGEEALAAIAATPPALLVLDLHLPGIDGWHVLDQLPDLAPWVPVVVTSSDRPPRARLERYHVAAFLPKPFDLDSLLALVAWCSTLAQP